MLTICVKSSHVLCTVLKRVLDSSGKSRTLPEVNGMVQNGCPCTKRLRCSIVARPVIHNEHSIPQSSSLTDDFPHQRTLVVRGNYYPQTGFVHSKHLIHKLREKWGRSSPYCAAWQGASLLLLSVYTTF